MNRNHTTTLHLTVDQDRVSAFFPLLAKGFTIQTQVGCSVQELITRRLGLNPDYMENRLQTIFLDGKAVDNVEAVKIRQDSTLALSAAMPGLAGATLRRGGAYAAMRRQITHKDQFKHQSVKEGTITLKLFNLVAGDIGPMFLTQGIWITGKSLQGFFRKAPEHLWAGCRTAKIDGMNCEVDRLVRMEWKQHQVFFKLTVE